MGCVRFGLAVGLAFALSACDGGSGSDGGLDAATVDGGGGGDCSACGECETCEGGACVPLVGGMRCSVGVCVAGACCAGCVQDGACVPGDSPAACGAGGESCTDCGAGFGACVAGVCEAGASLEPKILVGGEHTCLLDEDGTLTCSGPNRGGLFGTGDITPIVTPSRVAEDQGPLVDACVGDGHLCVVRADRSAHCAGYGSFGQLGTGETEDSQTFAPVTGGHSFAAIACGRVNTCAIDTEGVLYCWGEDSYGNCGVGMLGLPPYVRPTPVAHAAGVWASVSVGNEHGCSIQTAGGLECWGRNEFGQVGDITAETHAFPVDLGPAADVSAGNQHTCVVRTDGQLYCFGRNHLGQLGVGDTEEHARGGFASEETSWARVAVEFGFSCALRTDGTVACWGENGIGQLGLGDRDGRLVPTDLPGLSGVVDLALGPSHACALTDAGEVLCWGNNRNGELGTATPDDVDVPTLWGGS